MRQDALHDRRVFDAGQSDIKPLESIRKSLVVDAEPIEDGRLQISHVHRIFMMLYEKSSVSPWTTPPFTPAPASHIVKHRGWWSRP